MSAATRIPEGMTDPDEIDRWLDAQDAHTEQAAAGRADADDAVMAAVPCRRYPDAVRSPGEKAAIADRIAYDRLPWWQRWPFGPRPVGYVNRHPAYRY